MKIKIIASFVFSFLFLFTSGVKSQIVEKWEVLPFKKKEVNFGLKYNFDTEREEFRTDNSFETEKLENTTFGFQFGSNFWNFLDYKQEKVRFNFEFGPLWGNGSALDSSFVGQVSTKPKIFGIRGKLEADYSTRYYYNNKNFTIVEAFAWANYDWFKQNSTGTVIDSNQVETDFENQINRKKVRYGFTAKAGWGYGRLNAVNHYMLADYLLDKYYKGRNFSEEEIRRIAAKIGEIKNERSTLVNNDNELEANNLNEFLNAAFLLSKNENLKDEWELGEFLPRYNGSRVEFGPFFKYFNREPDLVYGAYVKYENEKYINHKWNRSFSAGINYNGYKRDDWVLAAFEMGWSHFANLKSQFDFGIKYVPGTHVNNFENLSSIKHALIPSMSYYSQINAKTRINLNLALRISEDEKFMLPGPEFSVSFYRSRY